MSSRGQMPSIVLKGLLYVLVPDYFIAILMSYTYLLAEMTETVFDNARECNARNRDAS